MAIKKKTATDEKVIINPANLMRTTIRIEGLTPFLQCKFSKKAKDKMMEDMSTEKASKKGKAARPVRNYDEEFEAAQYKSTAGWNGIPCSAFRAAMIRACVTVGLEMTRAKLSVFVLPDGFDRDEGTPLVRLHSEEGPERTEMPARLKSGSFDIRVRPLWKKWYADVTIEFDADLVDASSVVNLLDRAGRQVGIGEGRPFSRDSAGMGFGTFNVRADGISQPKGSSESIQA